MHVGLSGFLKHLGFLIRLFRLKDSQFFLIILHYYTLRYICLINYLILSNVFLNVLLTTSCLYEHEINNFFVRRLISTKNYLFQLFIIGFKRILSGWYIFSNKEFYTTSIWISICPIWWGKPIHKNCPSGKFS